MRCCAARFTAPAGALSFAEKDKGEVVGTTVAKGIAPNELSEAVGRFGIELLLAGKKEQARKVLAKAPATAQPAVQPLSGWP